MYKKVLAAGILIGLTSCASITNDAYVPMSISFSDGSSGTCDISNKRMAVQAEIPSSPMIRRSDDNLVLRCTTEDGRDGFASVPSTMGGKIVASAVYKTFGLKNQCNESKR
jgi:hypothetical protein